jgi:hypothetical protein
LLLLLLLLQVVLRVGVGRGDPRGGVGHHLLPHVWGRDLGRVGWGGVRGRTLVGVGRGGGDPRVGG